MSRSTYTFQLTLTELKLQPTVVEIPLTIGQYQELKQMSGEQLSIIARGEQSAATLSCQLSSVGMSGTPDELDAQYSLFVLVHDIAFDEGTTPVSFRLEESSAAILEAAANNPYNPWEKTAGVHLDHQPENARVVISIEGKLFSRYLYSPDLMKPYYYPLIGANGKTLIQDAPDDHLHHHGLWWGHDQVNGQQAYHEFAKEGRQTHRRFLHIEGGPVFAQMTSSIDWLSNSGKRLLQEVRTMRIYNLPQTERYVDVHSQLFTSDGEVVFGDTKEGGFPFIRVNEQINGHHTGIITASTGLQGEEHIFGTEADWVDYSGKIFGRMSWEGGTPQKEFIEAGIAMMVHPDYRDYSSRWFVRDYGPFTSANFHFSNGCTLPAGESIHFRQRIYLHSGSAETGRVQARYDEYAACSTVTVFASN